MLKWSEHLYLGKTVRSHKEEIQCRLNQGQIDVGHVLITYASHPDDLLDLIQTGTLLTRAQLEALPEIVGIAGTREEALELVKTITEEALRETGDVRLRDYLKKKAM